MLKPCPGVFGRGPCGRVRLDSQGYCNECRRDYQRDRYSTMRKQAKMSYGAREHVRIGADSCPCCKRTASSKGLLTLVNKSKNTDDGSGQNASDIAICDACYQTIQHLKSSLQLNKVYLASLLNYFDAELVEPSQAHSNTFLTNSKAEYDEAIAKARRLQGEVTAPYDALNDPESVMYGVSRMHRAEGGNLEVLQELYTWWTTCPANLIHELRSDERLNITRLLQDLTAQEMMARAQKNTDPKIKEALERQASDVKALEILRNYEFVPAGPPDPNASLENRSPFDDD